MSATDILDLRTLAAEWRDAIIGVTLPTELDEETRKYRDLCVELGIDRTPDDLEYHGNNNEAALINEDYFEVYAEELANELGAISSDNATWVAIDWAKTAANLRPDYTPVEYDGDTYYMRSR